YSRLSAPFVSLSSELKTTKGTLCFFATQPSSLYFCFGPELCFSRRSPMLRNRAIKTVSLVALVAFAAPLAFSQASVESVPPPYRGVSEHVAGVFVTPVP